MRIVPIAFTKWVIAKPIKIVKKRDDDCTVRGRVRVLNFHKKGE